MKIDDIMNNLESAFDGLTQEEQKNKLENFGFRFKETTEKQNAIGNANNQDLKSAEENENNNWDIRTYIEQFLLSILPDMVSAFDLIHETAYNYSIGNDHFHDIMGDIAKGTCLNSSFYNHYYAFRNFLDSSFIEQAKTKNNIYKILEIPKITFAADDNGLETAYIEVVYYGNLGDNLRYVIGRYNWHFPTTFIFSTVEKAKRIIHENLQKIIHEITCDV